MGLLILLVGWLLMGFVAAGFLSRHNRAGTGFVLGLLLGPIGVLIAFMKAESLDREKRDREARELDRHAFLTREQDIARAVAAALAAQQRESKEP